MSAPERLTPAAVTHWINGKPVAATSGRTGAVTNPATGQIVAEVGFAGVEDVDRAVAAAKSASHEWRAEPLSRRAEVMFRLHSLVADNRRRLAEIVSLENGKTIADALGEVARMLQRATTEWGVGILAITHFNRFLVQLEADLVHVMVEGRIVATGDADLALQLERTGYIGYQDAP